MEDNDKIYKWLLETHQQLASLQKNLSDIYGYISMKQIEDIAITRIKNDPTHIKNILICMPLRERHGNFLAMTDYQRMLVPKGYQIAGIVTEHGKSYADARNNIMEEAMNVVIPMRSANPGVEVKKNADYLLWIDDDIIMPMDAILKFIESEEPVITGVYHYKAKGYKAMNRYFDESGSPTYVDEGTEGIEKCDFLAPTGCLWMDLNAVRGLTRPFFEQSFPEDGLPHGYQFGEDRYFTQKCVDAGIIPKVHKGVQCLHVDVNENKIYGNGKYVDEYNCVKLDQLDNFATRRFRMMQV